MKHVVYLSLGSNMGDRRRVLEEAIERIGKSVGTVVRQ
jgi:2-amino-4-hydroxy-6-hydroxymethyldihydropteridine diphosphokinase